MILRSSYSPTLLYVKSTSYGAFFTFAFLLWISRYQYKSYIVAEFYLNSCFIRNRLIWFLSEDDPYRIEICWTHNVLNIKLRIKYLCILLVIIYRTFDWCTKVNNIKCVTSMILKHLHLADDTFNLSDKIRPYRSKTEFPLLTRSVLS